jgi:hypothetical protein
LAVGADNAIRNLKRFRITLPSLHSRDRCQRYRARRSSGNNGPRRTFPHREEKKGRQCPCEVAHAVNRAYPDWIVKCGGENAYDEALSSTSPAIRGNLAYLERRKAATQAEIERDVRWLLTG